VGGQALFDGRLCAQEVNIRLSPGVAACWPDYVFEPDYDLMPLTELRDYVATHKHLTGIPSSAEEVAQNYIEVSNTQAQLLRKVDELTLYVLQLEAQLQEMRTTLARD
jgi:Asp-tRNA(Asn)/Glu-tRNA(Gln) amidotransferase B subunit